MTFVIVDERDIIEDQVKDILAKLDTLAVRVCKYEYGLPDYDEVFFSDAKKALLEFAYNINCK
jgi:TPP-dependent indolepyruvate ferredoxin oxidoreductase alpha subunit